MSLYTSSEASYGIGKLLDIKNNLVPLIQHRQHIVYKKQVVKK